MSNRTNSHTISHAEDIFSGDATNRSGGGRGIPRASLVQVDLGTPDILDANGIGSEDRATAGDLVIDGALASGGVATMDVPRGVRIVSIGADTGTAVFTFYGTDQYGVSISEALTAAGTTVVNGLKAFKTVTRVAIDADTTAIYDFGTSDVLGLPFRMENVADLIVINEDDANLYAVVAATASAAGAPTAVATETQNSSALTVTNAINTVTAAGGSGMDSTQEGEVDALFAEIKVDLDANKVVVDQLVVESTDYKATIDALIVDLAALVVEFDLLVADGAAVDVGAAVASDATAATDTTGDVRGTYNPTTVLDGVKVIKLTYKPQARNTVGAYGVAQFRKAT